MAKKTKDGKGGKASKKGGGKGKDKQLDIPAEWVCKSVEELQELVAGLENDLDKARQSRNRAQVEHGSIQSYYDVTREQIRELDMKIEKMDLEIENTLEDNATELRVYEQKANFIKYCHENRLKESFNDADEKMNISNTHHSKQVQDMQDGKTNMRYALTESDAQHTREIDNLKQNNGLDLSQLKDQLDADVKLFEQQCDGQHTDLKNELEARREASLKVVESRKESHLADLIDSHQHRCTDMRVYFEDGEKQQQIDVEDLEAAIRRLKKAATETESLCIELKQSNEKCGDELESCSEKVTALEIKTKDKTKHATSLKSTNARLAATRKAIREAAVKYKQLQEQFGSVQEERDGLRGGIGNATSLACKADAAKHNVLDSKLTEQNKKNVILEQHLEHIVHSAGLDREKSETLKSDLNDFIQDNNKEVERLNLSIAKATKSYNEALDSCRTELLQCGCSQAEIDSINVPPC